MSTNERDKDPDIKIFHDTRDGSTQFWARRPRVALYVRVSSQDQAEGLSLQAQTRRLKERAESENWILPKGCIYTETVSAESLANRPQMLRALRDAEKDMFDFFAVMYQNRLARNTMDALFIAKQFVNSKAKIWIEDRGRFADTESKTGLLEFTMMAGIDTYQRMDIKERMDLGRQQARLSGRGWIGGFTPYGYRTEPIIPVPKRGPRMKLVPQEEEVRIIREIIFGKPEWSNLEVARYLNQRGISTKTGKNWRPKSVMRIRDRRLYCGEYVYHGQTMKAVDVVPILSKETWLLMQGLRRTRTSSYSRAAKHPLAGLAYCFYCGSRYYLHNQKKVKHRKPYAAYFCSSRLSGKARCTKSRSFRAWIVHEKLTKNIKTRLNRPGFLEVAYEEYLSHQKEADPQLEILALEGKIEEIETQKERLVKAIAEGTIMSEEAAKVMNSNRRYQKTLRHQIEEALNRTGLIPPLEEIKLAASKVDSADPETLRMLARALVEKILFTENMMWIYYRFWPVARLKVRIGR